MVGGLCSRRTAVSRPRGDPATGEPAVEHQQFIISRGNTMRLLGVPVLWWRSVGHTHTAYVVETMVDRLAKAAGGSIQARGSGSRFRLTSAGSISMAGNILTSRRTLF